MNDKRRKQLKKAIQMLNIASNILSFAADDEQDCLDNMPENLLSSDRCLKMEDNIDTLNDAENDINDIISKIEEVI